MEKVIVIMAAMNEEIAEIKNIMENTTQKSIYGIIIYEGNINGLKSILVKTGVGKVNAARTTQAIIDRYEIEYVINTGVAGGLKENLNIGDIIIGTGVVQHDFDITAFGHEKGYITDTGRIFESNNQLVEKAKKCIEKIEATNVQTGTIASGDIFCTGVQMKEKIRNKFDACCVEMEAAAVAQVCTLAEIPFLVIRSISDIPNGDNAVVFDEFVKFAAKKCAEFIKKMI